MISFFQAIGREALLIVNIKLKNVILNVIQAKNLTYEK